MISWYLKRMLEDNQREVCQQILLYKIYIYISFCLVTENILIYLLLEGTSYLRVCLFIQKVQALRLLNFYCTRSYSNACPKYVLNEVLYSMKYCTQWSTVLNEVLYSVWCYNTGGVRIYSTMSNSIRFGVLKYLQWNSSRFAGKYWNHAGPHNCL